MVTMGTATVTVVSKLVDVRDNEALLAMAAGLWGRAVGALSTIPSTMLSTNRTLTRIGVSVAGRLECCYSRMRLPSASRAICIARPAVIALADAVNRSEISSNTALMILLIYLLKICLRNTILYSAALLSV